MTAEASGGRGGVLDSAVGVAFWSGRGNTAEPSQPPYVSGISDCCGDIRAKKQVLNHRSVCYGGKFSFWAGKGSCYLYLMGTREI